ncbi:sterol 24-C-methyltransferase [Phakopsora pachyrhizi]|nr:sterol 24-C-methyltransferase [Phakopsora pachyrhizi]
MSPPDGSSVTATELAKGGDLRNRKDTKADGERRKEQYQDLVNGYYDCVTDLYEYGWGQGEAFAQGIARHEHYLAAQIGIKENMKVLDVGCGVGGPAREICWFSDANIVGINNNIFQVDRAIKYAAKAGLSHKLTFEKGNFMDMASQFGENTFDAVYAIEATVHAPNCEGVYGEVFKVLKPGGVFGFYEWCLTDKFNENDAAHRQIRHEIELGDAIPELRTIERSAEGLKAVGFEIMKSEDLATRKDPLPWYYPLRGSLSEAQTLWDYVTIFRLTTFGKALASTAVRVMETVGLAPKGSSAADKSLNIAALSLVKGGETGIFTPMQLFVCRKPL